MLSFASAGAADQTAMERAFDRSIRNALGGGNGCFDVMPIMRGESAGGTGSLAVAPWASLGGTHPMDVVEHDNRFELRADAPGYTADDISIEAHQGMLTISGQKKEVKEEKGQAWRRERVERRFTRSFALPTSAQTDNITAGLAQGVLTVTVPKLPESVQKNEPKRIKVQAGKAQIAKP